MIMTIVMVVELLSFSPTLLVGVGEAAFVAVGFFVEGTGVGVFSAGVGVIDIISEKSPPFAMYCSAAVTDLKNAIYAISNSTSFGEFVKTSRRRI